jgi:hypothetical protein
MKLKQIRDEAIVNAWLEAHFSFQCPPNIPVHLHEIYIDGTCVGAVATEDYSLTGIPHIYIEEYYRTSEILSKVQWLFEHVYCPLMKARGMFCLSTNCDQKDNGTRNFLSRLGFSIKEICVAEFVL